MRRGKRPPRRRGANRPLAWGRLASLLTVAVVASGLVASPVTALRQVRVVGAPEADEARLRSLFVGLQGVPFVRLDRRRVEASVLANPEIAEARFVANPFGSAVLRVRVREAVAVLEGPRPLALDRSGILYAPSRPVTNRPVVRAPQAREGPSLALTGSWPARATADLAARLSALDGARTWTIEVSPGGVISLYSGEGLRIMLGSFDRMEEKVERLGEILRARPALAEEASTLVLVSPENPVIVPRSERTP